LLIFNVKKDVLWVDCILCELPTHTSINKHVIVYDEIQWF
jgi:hypothetical protein